MKRGIFPSSHVSRLKWGWQCLTQTESGAQSKKTCLNPLIFADGEKRRSSPTPSRLSARSLSRSQGSAGRSRTHSAAAVNVARRKREMRENLEEVAQELLAHFNHRNLDALLKVTRQTLDSIRKRVTSSSHLNYIGRYFLYVEQV